MKYCPNCGKQLNDDAKFCLYCGCSVDNDNAIRQQVFAGKIIKCPNCGTEIADSYVTKCPGCEYELSSIKTSESLDEFKSKILEYDRAIASKNSGYYSWSTAKKIGWIMLCVYTLGIAYFIYNHKHKKDNIIKSEKKTFVEQYTFPNDRESLLDALIFMKERLYSLTIGSANGEELNWAKIWMSKEGHVYQKLQMLYPNDKYANETYNEAKKYYELVNKIKFKRTLIICAVIVGIIILSYICRYITANSSFTLS